ncbi:MAG TPA: DUF6114 domain-containing protein [Micromonosporaceae bacterium]
MTVPLGAPADAHAWVRGWRAFRRWRRSRPFWGPLLLMLAGVELFFSANLLLGGLQIHFGYEGFLSYLLPLLMLVTGVLIWLTPNQRVFYSIVGTVTAIYSLIGLNLGGWFCGMLLGILGGALSFAWTPTTSAPPPTSVVPVTGDHSGERVASESDSERITEPIYMVDDGAAAPGHVDGDGWDMPAGDDRERPGGSLLVWTGSVLLAAVLAAVVVAHSPRGALAAPCVPTSPPPSAVPQVALTPTGDPTPTATAAPTPVPTANPTRSPDATTTSPDPDTASCAPGGTGSVTPRPSAPAPTGTATVPPGPPVAARAAGRLTAAAMTLQGFAFDGVADLPTASGSVGVLTFSATTTTATDLALVTGGSGSLSMIMRKPVLKGRVRFTATRFSGKLLGTPFTYTPQSPPPATAFAPSTVIADIVVDLVLVDGGTLDAGALVEALTA